MARGLILDVVAGAIVATPFEKFFNYGEGDIILPDEPFEVTEKVDGSLGIIFYHDNRWRVATRGSFQSEQARWAEEWLRTYAYIGNLFPGITYLVEIVYRANRIVVTYDYEGLILLSAYNERGIELSRELLASIAQGARLRMVDAVQYSSLDELLNIAKMLERDREGFVVRFQSGLRVKIKGDEYCRIHRLISHVTPLAVWEMMAAGDDLTIVEKQLPEEFRRDFNNIIAILEKQFKQLLFEISFAVSETNFLDDKSLGLWLPTQHKYSERVAKWIFTARKGRMDKVFEGGSLTRRRIMDTFRPTSNILAGYTPPSLLNRFVDEETS